MDVDARIEALQEALARKDEEIARLEAALGLDFLTPLEWRLTGSEMRLFGVLMARESATKDALMAGLYRDFGKDEPELKIVDVFVCKIRKKLEPFGLSIETRWGQGYYLTPATRDQVRAALAGVAA